MIKSLRPHFLPFLWLLGLLLLTAAGAYLPLGLFNLFLSLFISLVKTTVVVLFFMELRKEDKIIQLASVVGVLWLTLFFMLVLTDYFSRFPGLLLDLNSSVLGRISK